MRIERQDLEGASLTDEALVVFKSGHAFMIDEWVILEGGNSAGLLSSVFRIRAVTSQGHVMIFDNTDVESITFNAADSKAILSEDEADEDEEVWDDEVQFVPTAMGEAMAMDALLKAFLNGQPTMPVIFGRPPAETPDASFLDR